MSNYTHRGEIKFRLENPTGQTNALTNKFQGRKKKMEREPTDKRIKKT